MRLCPTLMLHVSKLSPSSNTRTDIHPVLLIASVSGSEHAGSMTQNRDTPRFVMGDPGRHSLMSAAADNVNFDTDQFLTISP